MPCADYAHRPRLCREFSCGRECELCDACEGNIVFAIGGEIDADDRRYMELHGIGIVQKEGHWEMHLKAPCELYVKETPCPLPR